MPRQVVTVRIIVAGDRATQTVSGRGHAHSKPCAHDRHSGQREFTLHPHTTGTRLAKTHLLLPFVLMLASRAERDASSSPAPPAPAPAPAPATAATSSATAVVSASVAMLTSRCGCGSNEVSLLTLGLRAMSEESGQWNHNKPSRGNVNSQGRLTNAEAWAINRSSKMYTRTPAAAAQPSSPLLRASSACSVQTPVCSPVPFGDWQGAQPWPVAMRRVRCVPQLLPSPCGDARL